MLGALIMLTAIGLIRFRAVNYGCAKYVATYLAVTFISMSVVIAWKLYNVV